MPTAQETIDALTAVVARAKTVDDSAIALLNGIPGLISTAVTAALANGATAAQLAPLTDLVTTLGNETDSLAAAVTANTPAAPPAS